MFKSTLIPALLLAFSAHAHVIGPCDETGGLINSLVVPVAKNVQHFYIDKENVNGRVQAYNLDTVEPAAASSGIAFVLPDPESEMGDNKCVAIVHLNGTDITKAVRSYDSKGLLLTIPQMQYNPGDGSSTPTSPLKVRLNLKLGTVTIE